MEIPVFLLRAMANRFWRVAGVLLAVCTASTTAAQGLEFRGSTLAGRVDNLPQESLCRLGDLNSNGILDRDEFIGPVINIDRLADRDSLLDSKALPSPNVLNGELLSQLRDDQGYGFADRQLARGATGRTLVRSSDVELMHVLTFGTTSASDATQHTVDIAYGARFVAIDDWFTLTGAGDLTGPIVIDGAAVNRSGGPLAQIRWGVRRGRWNAEAGGSAALAWNHAQQRKTGKIGEELNPGGVNSLLFAQQTTIAALATDDQLAPVFELNLRLTYLASASTVVFAGVDFLSLGDVKLATLGMLNPWFDSAMTSTPGSDVLQYTTGMGVQWRR